MIQPLRAYTLIETIQEDSLSKGGIAVPDEAKEQPQKGKVLAIGLPEIIDGKEYPAEFKVGDIIWFGKWQGLEMREGAVVKKLLKFDQVYAKETK